jgi:hypothetical protein
MHTRLSRGSVFVCLSIAFCLVAAPGGPLGRTAMGGAPVRVSHPGAHCPGALSVPIRIEVSVPEALVGPGLSPLVEARVTAGGDLSGVSVALSSEGPVEIDAQRSFDLGGLGADQTVDFTVPVRYLTEGRSAVFVHVRATGSRGETFERKEALYAILRDARVLTGMNGYQRLEERAIEEDFRSGRIDETEARARAKDLRAIGLGVASEEMKKAAPATLQVRQAMARIPEGALRGVLSEGDTPPAASPAALGLLSADGEVTVQGTVQWLDENGSIHPVYGMTVQVRDSEFIGSDLVALAATGPDGTYHFVVNNDDSGGRDIFVRFITANSAVSIETAGIFGGPYEADSPEHGDVADGTVINEDFVCANTGTGPSCSLLTGGSYAAAYAAILRGGSFLGGITIEWPGDSGSANYDGGDINMRPGDNWDWDVEFHEYGHYLQDTINIEDNPGGAHNIGDCISDVHSSKSEGVRMAWAEGWPTFFGTTGQQILDLASLNVPRVGDVTYCDTGESNFCYSLETQDNNGLGEDNEVAVQRVFWDLFDGPADSRDDVSVSDQSLFDTIDASDAETLSQGWAALRATLSNEDDLAFGAITTDHQIGPNLASPTAGTLVTPSNANFSWNRDVGCSTTYDGDSFSLRFYDASTFASLLTVGGLGSPSASLNAGQIQALASANHSVLWAVEGSNTSGPATGPYLGENFAITVNSPPVADAGSDQPNVECTSHTTTPVQLTGLGSSDPDGDTLTYTWSAPGVVFDDSHSATPIGQFDEGTTIVTLLVSDGFQQDSDTVSITVVDTTPPTIICPAPIVVECSAFGGTPADDPQLAPFFAGVSAFDICDPNPIVTNDAPAFFPLGDTVVHFTATDDDLNASGCPATVTVQDTTPPDISVTLDRDLLWPPNHKLATIHATVQVSDICDPDPTFVLTSIVSSEPDDGLGDGDAPDDIQGADFGTADTQFQLRSERSGTGPGRTYTIVYTASDDSGNSTPDQDEVKVPHDQSGNSSAAAGFTRKGTDFASGATTYELAVLSTAEFDARNVDAAGTRVGNTFGVLSPMRTRLVDFNGDGRPDLGVTFAVDATLRLAALSGDGSEVAFRYPMKLGGAYLVPDIFVLSTMRIIR